MEDTGAPRTRTLTLLDKYYYVGIFIKGFDGAVELIVGILMLISPHLAEHILAGASLEVGEGGGHIRQFIAQYLAEASTELAKASLVFLVLYLIVHALVKLGLFYCLIRRIHRAYPVALLILAIFTVYQAYLFFVQPSIGLGIFTILDIIIVWLVYKEYREIVPEGENFFSFKWVRSSQDR